jgi:enoyl-CoA hydratase
MTTRRDFMKGMAVVSLGLGVPGVFAKATAAAKAESSAGTKRTLVVVQLAGGVDGLNTVVPYADGRYYDLRPELGIRPDEVLRLNDQSGLNPALTGIKGLYDEGKVAIVQGAGYPDPTFSHFKAMDIWQSADPEGKAREGWLGSYFDSLTDGGGHPLSGLSYGRSLPSAFQSAKTTVPSVGSLETFALQAPAAVAGKREATLVQLYDAYRPLNAPYAALLDETVDAAHASSRDLGGAHASYKPSVAYPETSLASGLQLLAELIDGGEGTEPTPLRVGHVMLGGFDTHTQQATTLTNLLTQTSESPRPWTSTTAPRWTKGCAPTRCAPPARSCARSPRGSPRSSCSRTRAISSAPATRLTRDARRRGYCRGTVTTQKPPDHDLLYVNLPAPSADGPLDGVALVVIDRHEVLNALDFAVIAALTDALEALDRNPDCRAIVITGAGERAFAAGADIGELAAQTPTTLTVDDHFHRWERIKRIRKPLIAAVRGFALGGGCELAMLCDMLVAGEDARFGQPEIKLGVMPGAGGTQRLTRAIGKARAMELILTGRTMDAREAEAHGLVTTVVPAEETVPAALALAARIAAMPPVAVIAAKEAVNRAHELPLEAGLEFERRSFYLLFDTEDAAEGMAAFAEKRPAAWKGR